MIADTISTGGTRGAQTLDRGLVLLHLVTDASRSARDLAELTGLGLSTTQRLLASLASQGFIARDQRRLYRAGPKLLELAARGREQIDIVTLAQPHLQMLSATTGICSFLGDRDHDYSVQLYRTPGRQNLIVRTPVGTRRLLPETSLGRALLLQSPEEEWNRLFAAAPVQFRPAGWTETMRRMQAADVVLHDTPSSDRLRAVACPVRDASGAIVAAISIVSPLQYASDADIGRIIPQVRAAAAAISGELGYVPRRKIRR